MPDLSLRFAVLIDNPASPNALVRRIMVDATPAITTTAQARAYVEALLTEPWHIAAVIPIIESAAAVAILDELARPAPRVLQPWQTTAYAALIERAHGRCGDRTPVPHPDASPPSAPTRKERKPSE